MPRLINGRNGVSELWRGRGLKPELPPPPALSFLSPGKISILPIEISFQQKGGFPLPSSPCFAWNSFPRLILINCEIFPKPERIQTLPDDVRERPGLFLLILLALKKIK